MVRLWQVTDYTGAKSVHYAVGAEHAIQKHLVHYGLLFLEEKPRAQVVLGFAEVCYDSYCGSTPPVDLEEA